jgi:hypothetical protein
MTNVEKSGESPTLCGQRKGWGTRAVPDNNLKERAEEGCRAEARRYVKPSKAGKGEKAGRMPGLHKPKQVQEKEAIEGGKRASGMPALGKPQARSQSLVGETLWDFGAVKPVRWDRSCPIGRIAREARGCARWKGIGS